MSRVKIKYFTYKMGGNSPHTFISLREDMQEEIDEWLDINKSFHIIDVSVTDLGDTGILQIVKYYESSKRNLMLERVE